MFSCEFCEIFKNTFFYRTPPVAASVTKTDSHTDIFQEIFWNFQYSYSTVVNISCDTGKYTGTFLKIILIFQNCVYEIKSQFEIW